MSMKYNSIENILNFEKTSEGYLRVKANLLKADAYMPYLDKEKIRHEKLTKEHLFSDETKKKFLNKKITLEHPDKPINSENVADYGKGTIIDVYQNGDYLGGTLQIENSDTIKFIQDKLDKNEKIQISAGYYSDDRQIDTDKFEQNITDVNHVAILEGDGRAGEEVRLLLNGLSIDEIQKILKINGGSKMENRKFKYNNQEMNVEEIMVIAAKAETEVDALKTTITDLTEKLKAKDKEVEEAKKETGEVEKKLNEAEDKIEKLETITDEEIRGLAAPFYDGNVESDSIDKILKDVVLLVYPEETFENMDKEAIIDKFLQAIEVLRQQTAGEGEERETEGGEAKNNAMFYKLNNARGLKKAKNRMEEKYKRKNKNKTK